MHTNTRSRSCLDAFRRCTIHRRPGDVRREGHEFGQHGRQLAETLWHLHARHFREHDREPRNHRSNNGQPCGSLPNALKRVSVILHMRKHTRGLPRHATMHASKSPNIWVARATVWLAGNMHQRTKVDWSLAQCRLRKRARRVPNMGLWRNVSMTEANFRSFRTFSFPVAAEFRGDDPERFGRSRPGMPATSSGSGISAAWPGSPSKPASACRPQAHTRRSSPWRLPELSQHACESCVQTVLPHAVANMLIP